MDRYIKIIKYSKLVCFLLMLISCGSEESPDEPKARDLLAKVWQIESIQVGGQPISHSGFSIEFNSNGNFSFNTQGIPGFPGNGNWELSSNDKEIILNSNIILQVNGRIQSNRLVFDYTYKNHKMGDVITRFSLK